MNENNLSDIEFDGARIENYQDFRFRSGNQDFETGWTKEERYLMNVAASKRLEALDIYTRNQQ